MAIVIMNENDEPDKDMVFGNRPLCPDLLFNRENEQEKRMRQLNELIAQAKKIASKYLCAIKTENEDYISECLDEELLSLIVDKRMFSLDATSIVDIAGFMIHVLSEKLHSYTDETVAI